MNVWVHINSGRAYTVLDDQARMKNSVGAWEPAVVYEAVAESHPAMSEKKKRRFVRTKENFEKSFIEQDQPLLSHREDSHSLTHFRSDHELQRAISKMAAPALRDVLSSLVVRTSGGRSKM